MWRMCMQVMPYSTGLSTPLANFEANQNYKDTVDPSVMVRPCCCPPRPHPSARATRHALGFIQSWCMRAQQ